MESKHYQGEFADAFYIILSGAVKVYINTPSEVKHFQNLVQIKGGIVDICRKKLCNYRKGMLLEN